MRDEINRTQRKDHNIESHRINKISYNDKKHTLKYGSDRLSHFHKSTR